MACTKAKSKSLKQKREEEFQQLRESMDHLLDSGNGNSAVATLLEIISNLYAENDELAHRALAAERLRYGRNSEKLSAEELGQLTLALGGSKAAATSESPSVPVPDEPEESGNPSDPTSSGAAGKGSGRGRKKKRGHTGRTKLSDNLTRVINEVKVSDNERSCNHCSEAMNTIGHVDHETLVYIPARIEVHVERREKIACQKCRQDIATADRGAENTESITETEAVPVTGRTRMAPSMLAHLLEAKADDAMPIHRIRDQFSRLGADIPINTLYDGWKYAARIIQPIAQMVLSEVLNEEVIGIDDTGLKWLNPDHKNGIQRGHLWCFVGNSKLAAFEFTETWEAKEVAPWIGAAAGFIQVDDYRGYATMLPLGDDGEKRPLVPPDRRLGCWMHTRRYFYKAFKSGEKTAMVGLEAIRQIYAIEQEARERLMSTDARHELRQQKSLPVAEQFFEWIDKELPTVRPDSGLARAMGYANAQKPFIMRCLADGRFELDTGRVERQIRDPVIGRKNYLFAGSAPSAQLLAGVYTLICSCRNLGISTRSYLIDVITKLQAGFPLRQINDLRPDRWAAAQSRPASANEVPQ